RRGLLLNPLPLAPHPGLLRLRGLANPAHLSFRSLTRPRHLSLSRRPGQRGLVHRDSPLPLRLRHRPRGTLSPRHGTVTLLPRRLRPRDRPGGVPLGLLPGAHRRRRLLPGPITLLRRPLSVLPGLYGLRTRLLDPGLGRLHPLSQL